MKFYRSNLFLLTILFLEFYFALSICKKTVFRISCFLFGNILNTIFYFYALPNYKQNGCTHKHTHTWLAHTVEDKTSNHFIYPLVLF